LQQPFFLSSCFRRIFLFFSTAYASEPNFFSSAGGVFYSDQNHCQPPLSTTSDPSDRSTDRIKTPSCQPGAFYSNPPSGQPHFSSNPLIFKEFSERSAPEVVRIIGACSGPSTDFRKDFAIHA